MVSVGEKAQSAIEARSEPGLASWKDEMEMLAQSGSRLYRSCKATYTRNRKYAAGVVCVVILYIFAPYISRNEERSCAVADAAERSCSLVVHPGQV